MKTTLLLSGLLLLMLSINLHSAHAKPQDQMGVIEFEESSQAKDPYKQTQDDAISYFGKLAGHVDFLAEPNATKVPTPSDSTISYLTAVYLYCVSKKGVCQELLDALLEIDVINAKMASSASCSTLLRFWKSWMKNDMEKRQKYAIKTTFMQKVGEFNANQRSKYIQCTQTVEKEIAGNPDPKKFFAIRYGSDSPYAKSIKDTYAILKQIKEKVHNVFVEVGASK